MNTYVFVNPRELLLLLRCSLSIERLSWNKLHDSHGCVSQTNSKAHRDICSRAHLWQGSQTRCSPACFSICARQAAHGNPRQGPSVYPQLLSRIFCSILAQTSRRKNLATLPWITSGMTTRIHTRSHNNVQLRITYNPWSQVCVRHLGVED